MSAMPNPIVQPEKMAIHSETFNEYMAICALMEVLVREQGVMGRWGRVLGWGKGSRGMWSGLSGISRSWIGITARTAPGAPGREGVRVRLRAEGTFRCLVGAHLVPW